MTPWRFLLTFLLVARSLASSVTTMSDLGRPVTDTRNDAAVEYVSTRTLPFVMILFANFHPRLFPPPPAPVVQFMNGLTALEAKTKAGAPCDVSNIRKRGRVLVKAGASRVVRPHKGPASQKPAKLKSAYRLRPGQVEKLTQQRCELKRLSTDAFKKVTKEAEGAVAAKAKGLKRRSVESMVADANLSLPVGAPIISASSVRRAVQLGTAGVSPVKRGRRSKVPTVLTDAAGSWARVGQVSGDEKTNTQLGQRMMAATAGTDMEGAFSLRAAKGQLKKRQRLNTTASISQDERRFAWTTYDNLNDWFSGWKTFLVDRLFGTPEPTTLPGGQIAELTMKAKATGRIINSDETHHKLTNEGDRGGSRANTQTDPSLPRTGRRKVANERHITGLHGTTAAGEVLPSFYFFDTSCEKPENRKFNLTWLLGLPWVQGFFGCGELASFPPAGCVTVSGGMEAAVFDSYLDQCIYPCFPDMSPDWVFDDDGEFISGPVILKIDSGPGRIGMGAENVAMREKAAARGLFLFPGLQNTTAVSQEMDELYTDFQMRSRANANTIVLERIAQRAEEQEAFEAGTGPVPTTVIGLSPADLGRMINGKDDDPPEKKPFLFSFGKAKVLAAWLKIGAMPLTRACLVHKKVRSVAGGAGPDADKFAAVGALHKKNTDALKAAGYKNTFLGAVPTHTHIARPSSEEDQIAALVKLGTINSKNMWAVCGATAFNSRVVMAAQTAILAKAENDVAEARSAAALELIQAEVAAAAAKERRGDKNDDTMPGNDLEAVVKFVHKKDSIKGWAKYNTKAKRVAFLASLVPVWTERVACDAPAVPPAAAAAAAPATAPFPAAPLPPPQVPAPLVPQPAVVNFSAMTAAERRTHMAALTAAMAAHDE